jgi:hypothetical protein
VRGASAVGTITARVPWLIALVLLLLLPIVPAIASTTIRPTMMTQTMRLWSGPALRCSVSPSPLLSALSAIGVPPRASSQGCASRLTASPNCYCCC